MFLVLKSPEHAKTSKEIKATTPCALDPFSKQFLEDFDLESSEARAALLLLAKMANITIADVECRHAALRRMLTRVQARKMELEDLASLWVSQRFRRRNADLTCIGSSIARPSAAGVPEVTQEDAQPTQTVQALGLWRTYIAWNLLAPMARQI